jgi:DNA invertase Pin-like site-specific DNA recombinase
MKTALYARVSTRDKQNPEVQMRELREYAAKRGWEVSGEYIDRMSGSKDSRPQLDAMMKLAKARKLDAIVVWKLDRFGRSLRHLVNAITELEAVGCAFISITNGIDLSTPQGRLMFHIIAAMGEFERELIRERVLAGLADAKAKGTQLGRPAVKREHDKDARKIKAMRDAGDSYGEIAAELGRSKTDIYRVCMTLGCSPAA